MSGHVSVDRKRVEDFESLREAVHASTSEIVQVDKGRMSGSLTHISIGDFSLSAGSFSLGVRSQGIFNSRRVTLGTLLDTSDRVHRMSQEMCPGDVGVTLPGMEHHSRYYGRTSFAAVSINAAELLSLLEGEPRLSDLDFWRNGMLLQADPTIAKVTTRRLISIVGKICEHEGELSSEAADFWKRSILEIVTARIMSTSSFDYGEHIPSAAALIRKVESHLRLAGHTPVHISEICAEFNVSRQSLHRAFNEILGVGPVTFLRHKRLCAVHSVLRDSDPARVTVSEVAMRQGFTELGRFAHYYHSLFGEYPSETLSGCRSKRRTGGGPDDFERGGIASGAGGLATR
jgi:AraC family ethanolamine operon transcriptional activator